MRSAVKKFREFVVLVGGVASVARSCGVVETTVYKWFERDKVPSSKAFVLLRLAAECGVEVSLDTVESWSSESVDRGAA